LGRLAESPEGVWCRCSELAALTQIKARPAG
jgi:hypothetical protein